MTTNLVASTPRTHDLVVSGVRSPHTVWLDPLFRVSEDWNHSVGQAAVLPEPRGLLPSSVVVGRVQFLAAVWLMSSFSCCLSAGLHFSSERPLSGPWHVALSSSGSQHGCSLLQNQQPSLSWLLLALPSRSSFKGHVWLDETHPDYHPFDLVGKSLQLCQIT